MQYVKLIFYKFYIYFFNELRYNGNEWNENKLGLQLKLYNNGYKQLIYSSPGRSLSMNSRVQQMFFHRQFDTMHYYNYVNKSYKSAQEKRLKTTDPAQKMSKRLAKKICTVYPLEINTNMYTFQLKMLGLLVSVACTSRPSFYGENYQLLLHFLFH